MWNAVQKNIGAFQRLFGGKNFVIVDKTQTSKLQQERREGKKMEKRMEQARKK